MPFLSDETLKPFEGGVPAHEQFSAFDQARAALDEHNATYTALTTKPLPSYQNGPDPAGFDFDVIPRLTPEEKNGNLSSFAMAKSDADVEEIRRRIDVERRNKQVLKEGPLNETMLALTAGILDPINYLPAVGPITRVREGILVLGAQAAMSAAIGEEIQQSAKYERSASESWASILMAAGLGAGIGAVAGAWAKPVMASHSVIQDVGGMIRSTGIGSNGLKADLMGSTSLSHFLDVSPRFQLDPYLMRPETVDVLNALSHADHPVLNRVNGAATKVDEATSRFALFENEQALTQGRAAFDTYIEKLQQAKQALNEIDQNRLPAINAEAEAAGHVAEQQRIATMEQFREVEATAARKGITRQQAIDERIAQVETQRDAAVGVGGRNKAAAELDAAVKEHEAAQKALIKRVDEFKKEMLIVAYKLGDKGRSSAIADILHRRDAMADAIGKGSPVVVPNALDWLKGIAQNPALVKSIDQAAVEVDAKAAARAEKLKSASDRVSNLEKLVQEYTEKGDKNAADLYAKEAEKATAQLEAIKEAQANEPMPKMEGEAKSVSAAATPRVDDTLWKLANSFGVAELTAKLKKVGLAAPSLELATSIFSTSNKIVHQIVDTGMMVNGFFKGIASPKNMWIEAKRMAEPDIRAVATLTEAAWKDYRTSMGRQGLQTLKKKDFMEQISFSLRRGDKSAIPEVEAVAGKLREIDKKYRDLMIENDVGVFKGAQTEEVSIGPDGSVIVTKRVNAPDVGKTAASHYLRSYRDGAMRARQTDFIEMATDYFERQMLKDAGMVVRDGKLIKIGKKAENGKPAIADKIIGLAGGEDDPRIAADLAATEVYHTILSHPEGRLPFDIKVGEGRGAAKARTFKIRDDFVSSKGTRFEDFLDNNPVNVMSRYVKTAANDVAYQIALGGDEGLAKALKDLQIESDGLVAALPSGKDSTRIVRQYEKEAALIQRLVEHVRGTTSAPMDPRMDGFNRTLRGLRTFNAVRSLGSVIFSQLPDLGSASMSEGMGKLFGTAMMDMVSGLKGIKMGMKEAQMFGTANDMVLMGRAGAMLDIGQQFREVSKFETYLDTAAHYAMNIFGIAPWTASLKGLVSHIGAHHILEGVEALATGKPLSERALSMLARDGIGLEEAKRIYAQSGYWTKHNGLTVSGAMNWDDIEAKNLFGSALLRRVDNAVVTPNPADAPLWTGTEIGKSVFQFKRFGWASNQRILVAGLQQRDSLAIGGMALAFGMGVLGTALRDISQSGKVKDRKPAEWAREGWDRSGLTSQLMELEAMFDKASGGHGPIHLATGAEPSRFASTGLIERAGGPTVGMLSDTSKALAGVASGGLTGQDIHNVFRLLPAQNFPAFAYAREQMENSIVNRFGLPARQTH